MSESQLDLIAGDVGRNKTSSRPQRASLADRLKSTVKLIICGIYDYRRFLRNSSITSIPRTQGQFLSLIMKESHRLEKGLSLPVPRKGFGRGVAENLILTIFSYTEEFGVHPLVYASLNVLRKWSDFCRSSNSNADLVQRVDALGKELDNLYLTRDVTYEGDVGAIPQVRDEVLSHRRDDVLKLFKSRRSVRQFSGDPVDACDIESAVQVAVYTPSVCNRQSARVHVLADPVKIKDALSFQSGNSGFGSDAKVVLIVTSNLESFFGSRERYQCWVDGGMFAMSLLIGLHAQGLGACALNWSASPVNDMGLRKALQIPENEMVIMMIAVGNLRESYTVAASPRYLAPDLMVWH